MTTNFSRQFDRSNLERTERHITHQGVIFQGLSYASHLLNTVHQMNRAPDRAVIHFDRNDLSHMYVFEQHSPGFAAIPCNYFRYAKGLTLAEHRAVLAYCRDFKLGMNEETLLQILWEFRSGAPLSRSSIPMNRRPKCTQGKQVRNTGKDDRYTSLMSRLGNDIQNFGKESGHV